MIHPISLSEPYRIRIPRESGDDPTLGAKYLHIPEYSPRERG